MAENEKVELPVGNVADILALDDSKEEWVDVPEWTCRLKVKSLTKAQQIYARRGASDGKGGIDESKLEGLLLVAGIVEPKFEKDHIAALFQKNATPLDRILGAIMGVSSMDQAAEEEAEADFPG